MFQKECKEYTEGAMLSVTAVRVSPDLSYAKVYLSIFPSALAEKTMNTLNEKTNPSALYWAKKWGNKCGLFRNCDSL